MEALRGREPLHAVGELDFAARALLDFFEDAENLRAEDVAARDDEIRRRRALRRLLDHPGDLECVAEILADRDDAVLVRLFRRHFLDGDDIAAMFLVGLDALFQAAGAEAAFHRHHVRQQHREGLVADDIARAPDRMAKPERGLLAGEAGRAGGREVGHQRLIFLLLVSLLERVLEFVGHVEMVLDHRLAATGDEDEMLDAGLARLIHDMLKHGPVDDRQHFLRHGFRGGQEARAKTGDGEDGFADAFRHSEIRE